MFKDLDLDQNTQNQIIKKVVSIAIRCTYYIHMYSVEGINRGLIRRYQVFNYFSHFFFLLSYISVNRFLLFIFFIIVSTQIASCTVPFLERCTIVDFNYA